MGWFGRLWQCCLAASLLGIAVASATAGTLTLSGTSYTQSFDSLGTGTGSATLPEGWDVRTGATATGLGSMSASVAKQTWGDNAKGFINTASATGLSSNSSTEAQGASTNRALGIRQASDFGDPGAAFNFNFNSTGQILQAASIDLVMLSVQGRSVTWSLQYGLGPAPTSFTTITTWTDPGVWGTTTVAVDNASLAALSNQPGAWLRLAAFSVSTGSGSRDTVAIDNIQIAYVPEPSAAAITISGMLVAFLVLHCPRRHGDRPPSGFTLTELLVAIAIIGTLVGMLLPAVQSARESARRSLCQNNLKQLALGLLSYESTNGRFPAAAIVSDKDTCNACFDPWGEARRTSVTAADNKHGTSWILETLPHMEQAAVFNGWNRATNVLGNASLAQTDIPLLYCPSRRSGIRPSRDDHKSLIDDTWRGGGTDYGGNMGRVDGFLNAVTNSINGRHRFAQKNWSGTSGDGKKEGLFRPDGATAAAAVCDGMSSTILVGELQRLRPLPAGTTAANTSNRTSQDGWAVGGVATLFVTATDSGNGNPGGLNNLFFESAGSDHAGGASFAMADGSVHWLSEFIDAKDNDAVFPLLGSMRDGQTADLFAGH